MPLWKSPAKPPAISAETAPPLIYETSTFEYEGIMYPTALSKLFAGSNPLMAASSATSAKPPVRETPTKPPATPSSRCAVTLARFFT